MELHHPPTGQPGKHGIVVGRVLNGGSMPDSTLAAFFKALETARRDLHRFAENYEDVPYSFFHAKPPASVPDDVWRHIADDDGDGAYEKLDFFPDRTTCLSWDKLTFDVKKFKVLCKQSCAALWAHGDLLATVPECKTLLEMPPGHHQWIRLIHEMAAVTAHDYREQAQE
jgi:hypothetical protein